MTETTAVRSHFEPRQRTTWAITVTGADDTAPETLFNLIEKTIYDAYPDFSGIISMMKECVTNG